MMEVEYRREMNRNYMVVRPQATGHEKYTIRMLSGNQIQGLLNFQDKMINGEVKYYYDITSKQPLSRILEHRNLSGNELRTLLTELLYTLKQMERFLLDEGQICFRPEYIYVEPETFKGSFCLIPGMRSEFAAELSELSQYLLDHVNQSDGDAVVLAFSVFRECRKLNFGIEDIERCLRQQESVRSMDIAVEADIKTPESAKPERTEPRLNQFDIYNEDTKEKRHANADDYNRMSIGKIAVLAGVIGAMLAIPVVICLIFGITGLQRWKWFLFGGELLGLIIIFLILKFGEMQGQTKNVTLQDDVQTGREQQEEPWEVFFREEAEREENEPGTLTKRQSMENDDDEIQTVLLNAKPIPKACRRLVSVNGEHEIAISYFPFLVGKNKDITDYCLNKPGVSRLHVKIEETEGRYIVTDLNSTNGTMVNGVMLEANGKTSLNLGDELSIAAERYYFR